MKFLLKIIFLTFNVSLLAGGTPLEIEISIGAGYDDNAMRFSDNEIPRKRDIGQVDLICRIDGVPIEILNTQFVT